PRPNGPPDPSGRELRPPLLEAASRCAVAVEGRDAYVGVEAAELTTAASAFVQLGTALGFLIVPLVMAGRGGAGLRGGLRRLGVRRFRVTTALKWMAAAIGLYLLFAILYTALFGEPEQEDI